MRVRSLHGVQRMRPASSQREWPAEPGPLQPSGRHGCPQPAGYHAPPVYPEAPTAYSEVPEAAYPTGRHALPPAPAANQVAIRQRTMMRPYAHTRGRTRPDYELALETLVSTTERGRRYLGATSVQHRRICDVCVDARSIAEIAAFLHLPLNVVKVLVSDMDNLELVVLHQPGLSFGDRSSREFMARVLEGLRSL
ncbi:DUF742 domain-containing protein [Amycolatopsis acidiphila]|uniref:DUF742 domain-containing protein n=2 Tax=Amycolatopsis acidiphila TaxID=715473 RepID=A0A558AK16_9PSEU|nr:DUF742 domain-containing protein [Amycolatopsis acidiphila]